jgi:uracil phosphoribosyltransferase
MSLPSNVHISSHPCLQAKLSLIRSSSTTPRETRGLVHDIATILGVEAFAGLKLVKTGTVYTPLPPNPLYHPNTARILPLSESSMKLKASTQRILL